jgi:hypothetical protein
MARRAATFGAPPLLPLSIGHVWAIEIVSGGALARFERDANGNWLRHVGEHVHRSPADAHVADPVQAAAIAADLAALERSTVIKTIAGDTDAAPGDLTRYGLERPNLIVLFYPRDDSAPAARLEFGAVAAGGGSRYARLRADNRLLAVAADAAAPVERLLQIGSKP